MPLHPFERQVGRWCRRHALIPAGSRVVAAVSGGPDSMALLHALHALSRRFLPCTLVVAHLNHGLRGRRGAADAAFVERTARRLELDVRMGRARIGRRRGGSVEAAAREARYAFLERVARWAGADRIAVGHTSDDQAETVLLRLCRGCGLRGVSAMAPSRPLAEDIAVHVIRPLLGVSREDVEGYLRGAGIRFRKDETNRSSAWTRNRVRLRILPLLSREVHPGAPRALARFAAQAAEAYRVVAARADEAERRCRIRTTSRGGSVRIADLVLLPPAVRAEIWMRLLERFAGGAPSFSEIDSIEEILAGRRKAASLRGGRLRVRQAAKELDWSVHDVP